MRIISGNFKGRRFNPPKNLPVRPTTDFAKESLFNVLNNIVDFEELTVLDLFSGTGSISLEFASRNAGSITSVDLNFRCIEYIRKNSRELKISNHQVIRANVFKFISSHRQKYDLIFADPPYDLKELSQIPDLIFTNNLLEDDGLLIVEHPKAYDFKDFNHFYQHRKYGNVNFSFFKRL